MSSSSFTDGVVLLCIDLQAPFVNVIADRDSVLRRCRFALAAAHGLGIPVIFTEQVPAKLGPTLPDLRALATDAAILPKNTFSAFADGLLRESLRAQEIEHVILCGIETPICIYQTALAALDEHLQVTLLTDAIGARRPADADACLRGLARAGVHLLPAETIFYALLHDTSHPFFREFTQLVKKFA